jgi:hypothetical protein
MKFSNIIYEMILREYNEKLLNQIIKKFQEEAPGLDTNIIRIYINRFVQIKNSPNVTEKDITKYTWKQLETVVDSNQPKRIKAGKINDGEPGGDSNLVYNENGLRIYVGKTKNACIKYGNGYSFCISSRGEENMYTYYRYDLVGTPYFIFDDTKTSEQNDNRDFIDPDHLLVLFVHEPTYKGGDFWYTITTADNKGEEEYDIFNKIQYEYPRLKGLKELFQPVEMDPKEKKILELNKKYNSLLVDFKDDTFEPLIASYNSGEINGDEYNKYGSLPIYYTIDTANKFIDDEINGEFEYYQFIAVYNLYHETHTQTKRIRNEEEYDRQYKEFVSKIDDDEDVSIYVDKIDLPMRWYKDYVLGVKKIVDQYRSELSKTKLLS